MRVRSRQWLVEEVQPDGDGGSPQVSLACADDDAQGQSLTVFWDYELDRAMLQEEGSARCRKWPRKPATSQTPRRCA